MLFSKFCNRVKARIVNKALVVSMRDAQPSPCVFRIELERIHAVSFIIHNEATAGWSFGMLGPKNEYSPVATFESKAQAERVLARVRCALLRNPDGACKRVANVLTTAATWIITVPVTLVITLLLVLPMFGFGFRFFSSTPEKAATHISAPATVGAASQPVMGVPVSADDLLATPQQ